MMSYAVAEYPKAPIQRLPTREAPPTRGDGLKTLWGFSPSLMGPGKLFNPSSHERYGPIRERERKVKIPRLPNEVG